ncbi:hypothetical protein ACF059_04980 [Streptomyces sp. NPDC016562]
MVMWIRTYDEARGLWQYFEGVWLDARRTLGATAPPPGADG